MRQFFLTALDALLPRRCVGCKRYDTWLCEECLRDAVDSSHVRTASDWRASCGIETITTLGPYGNPVWRGVIQQLKFSKVRGAVDVLGSELARAFLVQVQAANDIVLVPVPMHPRRLRERGFNQSQLIAEGAQRDIGGSVLPHAVTRVVHAKSQTGFSHAQRQQRLHGAFAPGPRASQLTGKHVIIVDDVVTTGATLAEIGRVMLPYQPASIHAIAIAHGS